MPVRKKCYEYSKDELKLIKNPAMSIVKLEKILGIGRATVQRLRKRLGIKVPIGSKKGPRPQNIRREIRTCARVGCNKSFGVVPSRTKKYCSKSCAAFCKDYSFRQTPEDRLKRTKAHTPAYKRYAGRVHRLSDKVYNENINLINPNRYPRTKCGVEDGWQLDHIVSVQECFHTGITPEEAANITNLRMLPWKENLARNRGNSN